MRSTSPSTRSTAARAGAVHRRHDQGSPVPSARQSASSSGRSLKSRRWSCARSRKPPVTVGVEDVDADEVAIDDDRVVVPAAVDVKDDVPESTVASATSPALAGLPPFVIAAVRPKVAVARTPRAVVPTVMRRRRRLARLRASTRWSGVFIA